MQAVTTQSPEIKSVDSKHVLMLRTCNADMSSSHGFVWPAEGYVEAPDWDGGHPVCGGKLHGFLWGEGDGSLADWSADAKWLVVRVAEPDMVELDEGEKYGFRCGYVVFCGDRLGATQYISENGANGKAIVGGTATAGYRGTATAGDRGTATAGDRGTATAGDRGTATAGYGGAATAGDRGTATAGDRGTATAGDRGTATAGDRGTATAGDRGILSIKWYDHKSERYRLAIGYVGEDGIQQGVAYEVREGKITRKL